MTIATTPMRNGAAAVILLAALASTHTAVAQQGEPGNGSSMDPDKARVIEYWTNARRAAATPRDLVLDPRGLAYLRRADGSLQPHGHQISAASNATDPIALGASPNRGPGNDSTPPTISNMDPEEGATIGALQTFSAVVTDDVSGVRSVTFVIKLPDDTTQSFAGTAGANDVWRVVLEGFTDGPDWQWWVVARDGAKKGGNQVTSDPLNFTVSGAGGGGGGGGEPPPPAGDTVTNAVWEHGGTVQRAGGRIYFELPNNARRRGPWSGYVCSGTVVTDGASGRSVILTAAHCVYDDVNNAYARNVLFIPDQHGTTGTGTDLNCGNDPLGCWVPSFGVVDDNWTKNTFPNNIPWDYAYYVVADSGAHDGTSASSDALDLAAGALSINFSVPMFDDGADGASSVDFTHALGYSYSDDPNFMYCAEDMTTEGTVNWWLPSCELSGGSSGGPWVQPMDTATGNGSLISVNSWGYTATPGMAGPILSGTSAECVFTMAKALLLDLSWLPNNAKDGDYGYAEVCP